MPSESDRPSDKATGGLDFASFREVAASASISLDQLGAAFADMLRSGDDPYAAAAADVEPPSVTDADQTPITPRSILEAMLFVGNPANEPLSSRQVAGLMRGVRPAEIDALVRELNRDYQARNCPYTIVAEATGYRLTLCDAYARVRETLYGKARQARLSQAAVEVLSIVAYHEPITADEIGRMRGKPSGHVLLGLVRRQLLRLERAEARPRRAQYFTTPRFLELFGLASLADLPRGQDLEQS